MTTSSRFAAVYDATLTTLRADTNLATLTVSDGLPITQERYDDLVIIGNSGDPEQPEAGRITQAYHDLAGTSSTRDETVTLNCCVMSQTGDVDISTTRTRAFEVLGWVESAIRANYGLGLTNVIAVEITDISCIIDQFADGTAVRLPFTLQATSII
jgi:hypothetical protein